LIVIIVAVLLLTKKLRTFMNNIYAKKIRKNRQQWVVNLTSILIVDERMCS